MFEPNPLVINDLPSAKTSDTDIYAYLIDIDNKYRWDFLYNPEKINFSKKANYQEIATAVSVLPDQLYLYTSGQVRTFNDLLLVTTCEGVALTKHIKKLLDALNPDIPNKRYEPPILQFIWGNESFGLCRLTEISGVNSRTLTGEFSDIRLNLTLVECPSYTLASREPTDQTIPNNLSTVRSRDVNQQLKKAREAVRQSTNTNKNQINRYVWNAAKSQVECSNSRNQIVAIYKDGTLTYATQSR